MIVKKISYISSLIIGCGLLLGATTFLSCKNKDNDRQIEKEDVNAKKLLQGIWINEEDGNIAFRAIGDTISYPDSTSQPAYFKIIHDTLIMEGSNIVKYPILKQAAHLFVFLNTNGDKIKLVKSDDRSDRYAFMHKATAALNQNQLIKRDTIVSHNENRYHCYAQINPTTYKVMKTSYTTDGVEVDNVYYDNIIHISIFKGSKKLFSKDFHKDDFARLVPKEFIEQSVFSDMVLDRVTADGIVYTAILVVPDSDTSYQIEVTISYSGKLSMNISK